MRSVDLIDDYRRYLEHFNRKEYPAFFEQYQAAARPFFDTLSPEDADVEASSLLDRLAEGWGTRRGSIRRELAKADDKQLLALFLLPAALAHGSEGASAFADSLTRQWRERWPKSVLLAGSFEDIQAGFPTGFTIGGITIGGSSRKNGR